MARLSSFEVFWTGFAKVWKMTFFRMSEFCVAMCLMLLPMFQNDAWMVFDGRQSLVHWGFWTGFGKMPRMKFLRECEPKSSCWFVAAILRLVWQKNDGNLCPLILLVVLNQKPWRCGCNWWKLYLLSTFQATRAWPFFCWFFRLPMRFQLTANDLLKFCLRVQSMAYESME